MIFRRFIFIVVTAAALGLVSTVDAAVLTVPMLYQNDPLWGDEKIDSSNRTIGEFGCTLTAWTMLINFELDRAGLKQNNTSISYTPAQINELLKKHRYTDPKTKITYDGWGVPRDKDGKPTGSETDLNIGALRKAIEEDTKNRSDSKQALVMKKLSRDKDIDAVTGRVVDKNYGPLKDAIRDSRPVVVRVNGKDTDGNVVPNGHTVLVIGLNGDDWVINDPYKDPDRQITTLSDPDYGNRIFGLDWSVFQGGGISDAYLAPSPYDITPEDLYNPNINPYQYGFSSHMPNLGKISPVPEPTSMAIFGLGALGLAYRARRRNRA